MTGSTQNYDVVLIGKGIATAICGARLSAEGRRVMVVDDTETDETYDGQNYEQVGHPELNLFMGLSSGYLFHDELARLGILDKCKFVKNDVLAQVVNPVYRICLHSDRKLLEHDLKIELSADEHKAVTSFMHMALDAPAQIPEIKNSTNLFLDTRSSRAILSNYVTRHHGRKVDSKTSQIMNAVIGFNSYVVPDHITVEQALACLAIAADGIWYLKGGQNELIKQLHSIIESAGGVIKSRAIVDSLVVTNKEIAGVLLSSFEGVVYSPIVVVGSHHQKIYSSLPASIRDASLSYDLSRVHSSHWRYTINLTVNRDSLPVGMGNNVVHIADPTLPLEEENYLMLRVLTGVHDDENFQTDSCTLEVSVLVPSRQSLMDYHYLRKLAGRMLRQLEGFVPFIDFNVRRIWPDFRKGIDEIRRAYPEERLTRIPERLQHYYVRGGKQRQSISALGLATPHPNLFFCGRIVWPSLGSYGEAISGIKVAQAILDQK